MSSKNLQRKIEHRYGISDPQFRLEMSVMLGPAIVGGNRITPLHNGEEIFPAMLEAIRGARTSLTFETFIYWSGEIGEEFTDALSEKARAGVPVNVLLDWVGSMKMEQKLLDKMKNAGARLHRYRPLRWYSLKRLNKRTHRKLLVADGCIGFTGGVGIADQWQGDAGDPEHWRDTHYRVEGPVVSQLQAAFNDNWIKTTGELLNGKAYFPELRSAGEMEAHLFIASPSGGSESMQLMYLMAIAAAEYSIDISASYFVPDRPLIDALIAARRRGVRIRVLLPGPHIDSLSVRIASKREWGDLLLAEVGIHVYQKTMLHNKLMIIDGEFISVGSTNFDMRSFHLNDEASLNIYDKSLAPQLTGVFEADLEPSKAYSYEMWRRRPLRQKISETILQPVKSQL